MWPRQFLPKFFFQCIKRIDVIDRDNRLGIGKLFVDDRKTIHQMFKLAVPVGFIDILCDFRAWLEMLRFGFATQRHGPNELFVLRRIIVRTAAGRFSAHTGVECDRTPAEMLEGLKLLENRVAFLEKGNDGGCHNDSVVSDSVHAIRIYEFFTLSAISIKLSHTPPRSHFSLFEGGLLYCWIVSLCDLHVSESSPFRALSLLVTGGAGFIGSNFVRRFVELHGEDVRVTVLDALTYAGNLENLAELEGRFGFVKADICDAGAVGRAMDEHAVDAVVHFAAESHVDRSILGPMVFTQTNVLGTHVLLEESRKRGVQRFVHVSTDEVYGSLGAEGRFTEHSPIDPTSPYAASKAASDLIVQAYAKTFDFPAMITRCSNNYGPWQFPEKLIPLMVINAMNDKPLPVYGDGMNVRDWIHARDHADAIIAVLERGESGRVYNIGSDNEWPNIDIVKLILGTLGKPESLIRYVTDRLAHDRRYAIDSTRIRTELGWKPAIPFEEGIAETIAWYRSNEEWWRRVISGAYLEYYERQYGAV